MRRIHASRRAELVAAILELTSNPAVRSYAIAYTLGLLQLPDLEQLLDELDATFYGSKPDIDRLIEQTRRPSSDRL